MRTPVVLLAALTVLFHVCASRAFSIASKNGDLLDAGGGSGLEQAPEDVDVLNQGLDADNLMPIKESTGNDLRDIRKREARSKKRSQRREGSEGGPNEKAIVKEIAEFLEPKKNMIIDFMKPILDRIKHRPKGPNEDDSPDSSTSPAPPTPPPPPSSTPSDIPESDSPTHSGSSHNIFSPYSSSSSSRCSTRENHRNMGTLSLLFPELESNKDEQPFVFVPFTNTLIRVVEQELMRESQYDRDSKLEI